MAQQFTVTVFGAANLPNMATGPVSAFATVNVLDPGEQIAEEGIETASPSGSPTSVVPRNPNPTWNAPIPVRKPIQDGARAVVTVWHKDDAKGMCSKIGRVLIPLPPKVNTPIKQNLEDDQGIVIQGAGGAYAPITVGITMPGQQLPDRSQFVNKAMTPGPSGRSARLTESQLERRGYTSDQIKRTLAKQQDVLANEVKNLKADINDELLRMAENEEKNPLKGMRDVPRPMPPSRHVDDLFMEPAGRPIGPVGPSAFLDGLPIWSDDEMEPFGGMMGRTAPMRPAMLPRMDYADPGYIPMAAPPMGGEEYYIEEIPRLPIRQPPVVRVPAPMNMGPPPIQYAPAPMRGMNQPPMQMGPPPRVIQGPPFGMPPQQYSAPMQMPPQFPPTIMAGRGMPNGMGGPPLMMGPPQMMGPPPMMGGPPQMMGGPPQMMGGPPQMMGGPPQMMGGPPQMMGGPPQMMGGGNVFLRPYDDHDLSGENF